MSYNLHMAYQHIDTRYAIEFVPVAPFRGLLELDDLPWQPLTGHDDYRTEAEAVAACDEFDAAFDCAYVHRYVARGAQ